MAKFKFGDRVKVNNRYSFKNDIGVVSDVLSDDAYEVKVPGCHDPSFGWFYEEKDLISLKGGRPKKEKPVQFIAFYDETDGDPAKKFTSKKELNEWLKEAQKDGNIIFDSIEVFPVGKPMKIEMSFKLKGVSNK